MTLIKKIRREISRLVVQLRGIIYFPVIYTVRSLKYNIFKKDRLIKKNIISILCPSRERPKNLKRFIDNLNTFSKIKNRIELVVYIDKDDLLLNDYRKLYNNYSKNKRKINFKLLVGEPKSVSKSWNDIADICSGDVMIMGNDDCLFETKNWDIFLDEEVAKFTDQIFVIWFDDGMRAHMYGDFPIVSRKWYEILGYFTPGCFEFTFNDAWITDIGRRVRRLHYVKKVRLTHLHADIGLQKKDKTWEKHRSGKNKNVFQRDEQKYKNTSTKRKLDANKILKYIRNN